MSVSHLELCSVWRTWSDCVTLCREMDDDVAANVDTEVKIFLDFLSFCPTCCVLPGDLSAGAAAAETLSSQTCWNSC